MNVAGQSSHPASSQAGPQPHPGRRKEKSRDDKKLAQVIHPIQFYRAARAFSKGSRSAQYFRVRLCSLHLHAFSIPKGLTLSHRARRPVNPQARRPRYTLTATGQNAFGGKVLRVSCGGRVGLFEFFETFLNESRALDSGEAAVKAGQG